MDGKLIYILIIIAYGIYSSYAKSKKEAEKKRAAEEKRLSPETTGTPKPVIEKPASEINSWEELIRNIKKETTVKKQAAPVQTNSQKSQAAYNKKKKSVQEKIFVPMSVDELKTDEMKIDVMKGIPDEGISTTTASAITMNEAKAYDIKEAEETGYQINPREAFIQSIIINRPHY